VGSVDWRMASGRQEDIIVSIPARDQEAVGASCLPLARSFFMSISLPHPKKGGTFIPLSTRYDATLTLLPDSRHGKTQLLLPPDRHEVARA